MNFKLFLPKQPIFFDYFKQLSGYLMEITVLFQELAANFNNFEQYSQRAKEIEHLADDKTHEISEILNKTFITPFDREDIYLLAHELDDLIDLLENVIHNLELYQVEEKKECLDEFAVLFQAAVATLSKLIDCLGQNQKKCPDFNNLKLKMHDLEDQGDLVFQQAIQKLFRENKDYLVVVKWKDLLENLEMIMDKYQRVCDVIESIIVKGS